MKIILILFSVFIFNNVNAQVSDFKAINFNRADNIAELNRGSSLKNLPLLAHKLTHQLPTDVEKFRAIYSWVCNNISGDLNQHNKVKGKRKKFKNDSLDYLKWNNQYKKTAFKKLLKYKKTMCTGYAYLIKELCFLANIECEIIDGYGRSASSNVETFEMANHSWNAVKLNNKWYLCDATWSSGYFVYNLFIKDYNEGYFLTDPILFAKNHYPINKKWLLNDTLIPSEFVTSPIVYGETFKHKIIPVSPSKLNTLKTINDEINFSFKTLEDISEDKISLIYYSGNNELKLKIYDLKNENGTLSFKHQFKLKGHYDLHLKINNDIVATYTIKVTKS